jgi:hypothetical protein
MFWLRPEVTDGQNEAARPVAKDPAAHRSWADEPPAGERTRAGSWGGRRIIDGLLELSEPGVAVRHDRRGDKNAVALRSRLHPKQLRPASRRLVARSAGEAGPVDGQIFLCDELLLQTWSRVARHATEVWSGELLHLSLHVAETLTNGRSAI